MRRICVVQARTTSTRLPGKVLLDLAGAPMIVRQLERLLRAATLDAIVVATSSNASDDAIVDAVSALGVEVFRGDEHDVLSRFLGAARAAEAEVVVRSTADCPLIDPAVTDAVVRRLTGDPELEYASNIEPRTYPRGLDVEAFTMQALERIARLATTPAHREHVTVLAYTDHAADFRRASVTAERDDSDLSWTVDTLDDLERVRRIYEVFDLVSEPLPYTELVRRVRERADLQ